MPSESGAGAEELFMPYEPLEADGLIVVLDGASGVGKSTTAAELCSRGIVDATPTWTTRTPRPGEASTSYDHLFVSEEEFERHEAAGGFIDLQTLYGNRYGMPYPRKPAPGKEALIILKPQFIPRLLQHYPYARIHQIAASRQNTEDRMRQRGQTDGDIEERLRHHDRETAEAGRHAHIAFDNNGSIERTVAAVQEQIRLDRRGYDLLQLVMKQA